jgi:sugar lactone lactonase YvrE
MLKRYCRFGGLFLLLTILAAQGAGATNLEVVAEVDVAPGNITVTPDGRVILSLHPLFSPSLRVAELTKSGKLIPFPNEEWNKPDFGQQDRFDSVLGMQCDTRGVVWMLDNGLRGGSLPRLLGWDLKANRMTRIYTLTPPAIPAQPVFPDQAFLNDLAVDLTHNTAYISHSAGMEESGLIVVDLGSGKARRVLQGHESVIPDATDIVIDGRTLNFTLPDAGRLRLIIGANGLALDSRDEWLYYGSMNGKYLYRLRTADLVNASLTEGQLAERVERYSRKPVCEGLSVDNAGNIYVTDLQNKAIGVITTDREYRILVEDNRILWPESFSFGPDGKLYFVASKLQSSPALNGGRNDAHPPFFVFRITTLAPGTVGR